MCDDISRLSTLCKVALTELHARAGTAPAEAGPHVLYADESFCVLLWNRYVNSFWSSSRITVGDWSGCVVNGYGDTVGQALEGAIAFVDEYMFDGIRVLNPPLDGPQIALARTV